MPTIGILQKKKTPHKG